MKLEKLEVKANFAISDTGEITGLAWFYGEPDSVGDTIVKGAFGAIAENLPILFQHSPADLIGTWTEIKEGPDGLQVKGQLHLDHLRARTVFAMLKNKLVDGLSIGFRTKQATKQGRKRVITALDLAEISVVRDPAHPRARISSAKEYDAALAVAAAIREFTANL
ncbi:HK97 family phage prohead protease [Bradyrhizobium sp. Pha-3]|uniref:HK97 family phage prohead protease n=1 Tax=Bradyrhizobium sp. Pha-3 TaxID=208375 RepID=UPI0035D41985